MTGKWVLVRGVGLIKHVLDHFISLLLFDTEPYSCNSKRLGVLKSLEELEHNLIDKKIISLIVSMDN